MRQREAKMASGIGSGKHNDNEGFLMAFSTKLPMILLICFTIKILEIVRLGPEEMRNVICSVGGRLQERCVN